MPDFVRHNPLRSAVALCGVALLALFASVYPPGVAHAQMNEPAVALTMIDETTGGGTAPLDSAVFSVPSDRSAAAARFTVWISSGSAHEEFGFWHRPSSTGAWTFTPLLANAELDDAKGAYTGVLGLREGWEYSFDFAAETRGTIIVDLLYDGVS